MPGHTYTTHYRCMGCLKLFRKVEQVTELEEVKSIGRLAQDAIQNKKEERRKLGEKLLEDGIISPKKACEEYGVMI